MEGSDDPLTPAQQAEVDLCVREFNAKLSGQGPRNGGVGYIGLAGCHLTPVQSGAVERFRQSGWTVLVHMDFSSFAEPRGLLVFKRQIGFDRHLNLVQRGLPAKVYHLHGETGSSLHGETGSSLPGEKGSSLPGEKGSSLPGDRSANPYPDGLQFLAGSDLFQFGDPNQ